MSILSEISENVQRGEDEQVGALVRRALDQRRAPLEILNDGLVAGMNVVGEQFRVREIFLPDVLMAARAMNAGLDLLKPLLASEGAPRAGRVVIGSVRSFRRDVEAAARA